MAGRAACLGGDCQRPVLAHELCAGHYRRKKRGKRREYLREYLRWLWPHRWALLSVLVLALIMAAQAWAQGESSALWITGSMPRLFSALRDVSPGAK